jgi:hypothetical protein
VTRVDASLHPALATPRSTGFPTSIECAATLLAKCGLLWTLVQAGVQSPSTATGSQWTELGDAPTPLSQP